MIFRFARVSCYTLAFSVCCSLDYPRYDTPTNEHFLSAHFLCRN